MSNDSRIGIVINCMVKYDLHDKYDNLSYLSFDKFNKHDKHDINDIQRLDKLHHYVAWIFNLTPPQCNLFN